MDPEQVTILSLIGGITVAGLAKQWVFGWVYRDKVADYAKMEEDRDFWRDTALQAIGHTDKALAVAGAPKKKVVGG